MRAWEVMEAEEEAGEEGELLKVKVVVVWRILLVNLKFEIEFSLIYLAKHFVLFHLNLNLPVQAPH